MLQVFVYFNYYYFFFYIDFTLFYFVIIVVCIFFSVFLFTRHNSFLGLPVSKLMIPLSYSAILGGVLTNIGTRLVVDCC